MNDDLIHAVMHKIHEMWISKSHTLADFIILYVMIFTGIFMLLVMISSILSWFKI